MFGLEGAKDHETFGAKLARFSSNSGLQVRHPEAHGNVRPAGAKDHETFGAKLARFSSNLVCK